MYSSEDLERFYFQYQTEAMPKGISIEQFCSRNNVPLVTKEILISFRQHLGIEKDKDSSLKTPYLIVALNYLDTFWDNIFSYIQNGCYPIDNNSAERAVRPLTTQRNSMLHFGSDEGAEMV